jgi:hypothetical protein
MRNAITKWEVVIDDQTGSPATADVVVALIELLWHGHRDRHSGGATSKPVTQEQAQAARPTGAVVR